jgi:hypothetical protein
MLEPTPIDTVIAGEMTAGNLTAEVPLLCVVCSGPSEQPEGCCSLDCARRAEQELWCNTARIRRANGDPGAVDLRRAIAERNGRLTSALLRWRPRPVSGPARAEGQLPTRS